MIDYATSITLVSESNPAIAHLSVYTVNMKCSCLLNWSLMKSVIQIIEILIKSDHILRQHFCESSFIFLILSEAFTLHDLQKC